MTSHRPEASSNQSLSTSEAGSNAEVTTCSRCGVCCEKSGPGLVVADLELVRAQKIPWSALMTVRVGEPVHSHLTGETFFLTKETIKIREVAGGKSCVLYDKETKSCTIHHDKPQQCRAQACWDPQLAEQAATEPPLDRERLFQGVAPLLELIAAHERRCPCGDFYAALEALGRSQGHSVNQALPLLAFDEHVRSFAHKELGLPEAAMDLFFGRSLSQRVRLYDLQVVRGEDGSRTLLPLNQER